MLQFKLQQSLFVVDSTRDVNNCCDIHHIYFPLWIYSIEPNNFTTSEEKKCKIFIVLSIGTAAKRSFISVQRVFFLLLSFHRRNKKNVPKNIAVGSIEIVMGCFSLDTVVSQVI